MSFEIDRDKAREPSVYDMTRAAIKALYDNNPRGFFAFIESENIDTASHLSDITSVIHDYREFDRAVGLAYEFYRKYPRETLILVTSDHETGGLGFTLALKDLSSTAGSNQVAGTVADFKKLQSIDISLQKATQILGPQPNAEAIEKMMREHFRGFTLAPEFKEAIIRRRPFSRTLFGNITANALGLMIANNTQIYWQNSAHTNQPVLVAALGVRQETKSRDRRQEPRPLRPLRARRATCCCLYPVLTLDAEKSFELVLSEPLQGRASLSAQ